MARKLILRALVPPENEGENPYYIYFNAITGLRSVYSGYVLDINRPVGIKDVDGIEIFEDDLLGVQYEGEWIKLGWVVWDSNKAQFVIRTDDDEIHYFNDYKKGELKILSAGGIE